ncbi:MOSC domain-containing protein [Flavihumibacter fluvii]|uniref:MOSC domain-containing protein n=1 Tax=Flavihumibacter fluvii TaxID=2838157 RepID=UPI001BDDE68D|nr:MOSC N-terminal beta barrel domain-containing protein [Flavihumibacter fluvii]ULQ52819.1 MOSC domain-containing protein [Flavihumibacter fluvii]
MLEVSELFIYPIKSLGGIAVQQTFLTDRGFQYDRRWLLVDDNNIFLTQRDNPKMALLQTVLGDTGLSVFQKHNPNQSLHIPFDLMSTETVSVTIWEDTCLAQLVNPEVDQWFSQALNMNCHLVYMPDHSRREVDPRYATQNELTSFSDGYPTLIIGQASLDDLNARLPTPVPINRFRPNIVFTGGQPYEEDKLTAFQIKGINFSGVKLCGRCMITTINQETAETGKDPLRTLAGYRLQNNNVMFGMNLLHEGTGWISVGDLLIQH